MSTQSTLTLTLTLDMPSALRLARYEVETGNGLENLLLTAIEAWEREGGKRPPEPVDYRVDVEFPYTPRGQRKTWVARGRYDPESNQVEIIEFDRPHVVGFRGAPSTAASEVVTAVNPEVDPRRNGLEAWHEVGTGRSLTEIRRYHSRRR